ncbi:hypothetical protein [Mesorhizobium sp. M0208]|uniref:hypothetical protein n=1 Tax=Mesorhizobium sp. M0208 TaxID=2956916 RepID=UPI003339D301
MRLALQNPLTNFGQDEYRALLASIIVHDAGTPAFAHLFEYQLHDRYEWDHERVVPDILQMRHHSDARTHQFFSARRLEFAKLCEKADIDFDIVLAILERRHTGAKLIFGSIDFDNLDNVTRMNWMLGNRFDIQPILDLAASLGANASPNLLLPESQSSNLAHWAKLRRMAYEVIVFDELTVSGQAVLSEVIADALSDDTLALEDWFYTDAELISVLRASSASAKTKLERDFFGRLPRLRMIAQLDFSEHPAFNLSIIQLNQMIKRFLGENRVSRPYSYVLRDRGTFEKRIDAIDPSTGNGWSFGSRSDSLIFYGFGGGSGRTLVPKKLGAEFIEWLARVAC